MEQSILQAIDRIRQMEQVFDTLQQTQETEQNTACFQALLQLLCHYYENGQWLADYYLDEQGLLPPDLKRGILSQDGVYNFLAGLTLE